MKKINSILNTEKLNKFNIEFYLFIHSIFIYILFILLPLFSFIIIVNNLLNFSVIGNKSNYVEKKIILLLIKRPDLILNTKDVLSGEHFKNIICRRIYEELLNFYSASKDIDVNRIMNGWLGEKEVQNIVSELVCEDVDYHGNEMKFLNDYLKKIKINITQDKLKIMSSEIRFAQEKKDDSRVKDLLIKYQELDNTTRRRNEN